MDRSSKTIGENNLVAKSVNDDSESLIKIVAIYINPNCQDHANPFQEDQIDDEDGIMQETTLMLVVKFDNSEENIKLFKDKITSITENNNTMEVHYDKRGNHVYFVMDAQIHTNIKLVLDCLKRQNWVNENVLEKEYAYIASCIL